jgi:NOL1/NOP2/fmu family ribosome biogenesis protein
MTYIKTFSKKEKQEIERKLKEQFGVNEIPGVLIKSGKDRIFLFTGKISENEINRISKEVPIERTGLYFARIVDDFPKLSIEGTQILKEQIKKNIFELNKEQLNNWMNGRDLQIKTGKKGFFIMKHNGDFLGCGKISVEKISNFIPKSRRLKNKEN